MTIQEQVDNVNRWQTCGYVHPLTCNDSNCRANLIAYEQDGKVILVCPECNLVQNWVPDVCLSGPPFPDPFGFR